MGGMQADDEEVMGFAQSHSPPNAPGLSEAQPPYRCGHCRTVMEVPAGQRQVCCPECGWLNAVPRWVPVVCERCGVRQRARVSRRNAPPLCASCGYSFRLREIELSPRRRRVVDAQRHVSRHDRAVLTLLIYALTLALFLWWLTRR